MAILTGLFCLISLWLPWTYVAQDSYGTTISMNGNGFKTIPATCFLTCADGSTSPASYLLLLSALTVAVTGAAWLALRHIVLLRMMVAAAIATAVLAIVNFVILYLLTASIIANYQDVVALPHVGAALGVLSGSAAIAGSAIALTSYHRALRAPGVPRVHPPF